jgi:hypothetical protein
MFSSNRCPSSLHLSGASTLDEPALAVHPQYLGLKIEIIVNCRALQDINGATEEHQLNTVVQLRVTSMQEMMSESKPNTLIKMGQSKTRVEDGIGGLIEHCSNKSELAEDGQIP